ncbi:hypothetical protein DASC09_003990 [Saccharomycopsis crataegensis]|uniref:KN homeodomain domain-containing protein n=1 Tax=Saccharomycopsis crataegensis TaxID=43959 RepID=A0AAV5QFG1_9ASCO|nr:hypothetical protein DASC09_003990 [Saccharomycopsis crataegensis]
MPVTRKQKERFQSQYPHLPPVRDRMPPFAIHGEITGLTNVFLLPKCTQCHSTILINGFPAPSIGEKALVENFFNNRYQHEYDDELDLQEKHKEFCRYVNDNFIQPTEITYPSVVVDHSLQVGFECPLNGSQICDSNHFAWDLCFELTAVNSLTGEAKDYTISSKAFDKEFAKLNPEKFFLAKFFAPWVSNKSTYFMELLYRQQLKRHQFEFFFYFSRKRRSLDENGVPTRPIKAVENGPCPFIPKMTMSRGGGRDRYLMSHALGLMQADNRINWSGNADGGGYTQPLSLGWYDDFHQEAPEEQGHMKQQNWWNEDEEAEGVDNEVRDKGNLSNVVKEKKENDDDDDDEEEEEEEEDDDDDGDDEDEEEDNKDDGEDEVEDDDEDDDKSLDNVRRSEIDKSSRDYESDDSSSSDSSNHSGSSFSNLDSDSEFERKYGFPLTNFLPEHSAKHPTAVHLVLLKWLYLHLDHPFPNRFELSNLKDITGLSTDQVYRYFKRHRKRTVPRMKALKRKLGL